MFWSSEHRTLPRVFWNLGLLEEQIIILSFASLGHKTHPVAVVGLF